MKYGGVSPRSVAIDLHGCTDAHRSVGAPPQVQGSALNPWPSLRVYLRCCACLRHEVRAYSACGLQIRSRRFPPASYGVMRDTTRPGWGPPGQCRGYRAVAVGLREVNAHGRGHADLASERRERE